MARANFPDALYLIDAVTKGKSLIELELDEKTAKNFPYRQRYKAAPEYGVDWERVARAETHPIRILILEALAADGGRTLSPAELARETEWTVNLLAYHFRELEKRDLVKVIDTQPKRGALEHIYGLVGE
jgi:hypothetical protein